MQFNHKNCSIEKLNASSYNKYTNNKTGSINTIFIILDTAIKINLRKHR